MRFLSRINEAPRLLEILKRKNVAWKLIGEANKNEISQAILVFQGQYCAYCEASLINNKHIEHFAKRSEFPKKIYEWDNLFLSCESKVHCGHFKDNINLSKYASVYDYRSLIKPDVDNPSDFLFFSISGEVLPKKGIDKELQDKAELTINVFNLNEEGLKNIRSGILLSNKEIVKYIYSLGDDLETAKLLEEYKQYYSKQPYSTALLDLLLNTPEARV
ncbi:retron Ec78 anti-phage system effector HNH endonuclease PtuB [Acinetobacter pittii]|uniref:retron Ec78 anti-phage system effector HNH endonuclease PtuB n=1 Tax=Acinetobacter pittii TaxID=48296 RepID=UPI002A09E926|nr:retron Ec78 anti-phage system effector HNH endonuclease PtuB [Acinetobacter pittii]MDX8154332.1 retron Ec78 anti-phage system effector HNH endonuclease PtuB [Acinetobacter pittii]